MSVASTNNWLATSPRATGFRFPAEWDPHRAVWAAWPGDPSLWRHHLGLARKEFAAMCRAIVDLPEGGGSPRGESLEVLVRGAAEEAVAAEALEGLPVRFHRIPFGDIWLRDTAPLFARGENGEVASLCFRFNGWGGKYPFEEDMVLARAIAQAAGLDSFDVPMVLEGGAVEVDGEGTLLTTRQCLLNPNRNPSMSQEEIESGLIEALGVERVLWLGEGLVNDHTDGHVDTLARFVAPGRVLCMEARDAADPNRRALEAVASDLEGFRDALGRPLEVVRVPSPGLIEDEDGNPMPASYVNWLVANTTVIVPVYGSRWDDEAVATIAACFPERRTVGLSARAILSGGGAFHCITQQETAEGGR